MCLESNVSAFEYYKFTVTKFTVTGLCTMVEPTGYSEEIDFQKYWYVLKRRWLVAMGVFGAVLILSSLQLLRQKPSYVAESKLIFKQDRTTALTGVAGESDLGNLRTIDRDAGPLETQAEIIKSVPISQEVIQALNLDFQPEELAAIIKASPVRGTDVLAISFTSGDPDLSLAIVNKIVEVYLRANVQANRAEAAAAREFIMQQLPSSEAAVSVAEAELRRFKESNGIVSLTDEANAAVSIISNLDRDLASAQVQLAEATARSEVLRSQIGLDSEQAIVFAALSQSSGVQNILTQLQTAQAELSVEQTRYLPGHPAIANLERRIDALNALLQERIGQVVSNGAPVPTGNLQLGDLQQGLISDLVRSEAERVGLSERLSSLSSAQSAYRARANALPRLEETQRELERRLRAAQTTYEVLLSRLQEVQVAENQNIGNARALSSAIVSERRSDRKMGLAMGGGVGILLAVAAAFGADLLDRSVKTLKEAKDLFGYTLLGVIPILNSKPSKQRSQFEGIAHPVPRVYVRELPFSTAAEAYQMLQANLRFLRSDKEVKTVVVTSSVSQEGKSEVAANLAASMAQVGRRVLLVDADMRYPVQHHVWDLVSTIGLSNVIVEQFVPDVAIQEVAPNLYALPSGIIPPNPIALLDSKRMASLVEGFAKDYDLVIFDTPPLAGKADAAVLGKLTDGILLVVRPGVINSASANAAKEFLKQSGQNVLGMVINGVDVRSEPDSYFYHTRDRDKRNVVAFEAPTDSIPTEIKR
jgi:succinoglycan biosynthesis transport protein ExoP